MANVGKNTKAVIAAYYSMSAAARRAVRQRVVKEIGLSETAFRARLRGEIVWRPLELEKAMEILGCNVAA